LRASTSSVSAARKNSTPSPSVDDPNQAESLPSIQASTKTDLLQGGQPRFTAAPASAKNFDERVFFTFSAPIELPGVALPAGKYIFRLADPTSSHNVVQVLSGDGMNTSNIVRMSADGSETKVSAGSEPAPSAPTGTSPQGAAAPESIVIPRVVVVLVPAGGGR
jgi:hypothetical protein